MNRVKKKNKSNTYKTIPFQVGLKKYRLGIYPRSEARTQDIVLVSGFLSFKRTRSSNQGHGWKLHPECLWSTESTWHRSPRDGDKQIWEVIWKPSPDSVLRCSSSIMLGHHPQLDGTDGEHQAGQRAALAQWSRCVVLCLSWMSLSVSH